MEAKEQLEKVQRQMDNLLTKGSNDEKLNDKHRKLLKEVNGW